MKAVRGADGGVAVVDLDEPPGAGELLEMKATSVCASDLSYLRFGSRKILGHELAGIRADGTPVVVEALYGCLECEQCARGAYKVGERLGARVGSGGAYDVVVEAAGSAASLARSIELAAPGGTVVVLGVHFGPVEIDWMPLFHREARVVPSLGYCRHDGGREMEEAAAMIAEEPQIARTLITHRYPIEDAGEAFRVAGDKTSGAIRVVIEP